MSESIQVRSRGGKGGHKYNKVNQQKKFHLLSLIYRGKMGIREVFSKIFRLPNKWELTISQPKQSSSSTKTTIKATSLTSRLLMPLRAP